MTQKQLSEINYSVLDLAPITEGGGPAESYKNTIDLARYAEDLGFTRYWLAEHHSMPFIASSATSVLIGHVASHTNTIRVGSGGIMLPNHAPLMVAEQFGTLETLYPGRIDLGLGRAPGTDQVTAHALRRGSGSSGHNFPQQLDELRGYFHDGLRSGNSHVRAIPGEGLDIPIWLLGSSGFSAQLAGQLGLPFAFASHFSPNETLPALQLYRDSFEPSEVLQEPYAMVGVNVVAAKNNEQAEFLSTSLKQQFINLIRNTNLPLQPPVESMDTIWTHQEEALLQQKLGSSIIGGPEKVKDELQSFLDRTEADEMMVISQIYNHKDRLNSYKILADITK
ncbi:LLM class flavin-dependent oxidoreductase [Halobacillus salinarum]|uniref:LLM class flavin-dependent oxidoreductase n=1 Tax=Halobacillus salinarum TaxID=2932257 RepID=A0ABY4ELN8_9BACI|nr:LLM class flavin-dependent oxidoreductase [Halobacillus salinarum]UOQ45043.1 LLM class flavin-dependent oxidoreductase [Halobacillus salinarum]